MVRDFLRVFFPPLLVAAAAFILVLAAVLLNIEQNVIDRFVADCHRLGGHIYGDGIYLCLDDTGRVLEARQ